MRIQPLLHAAVLCALSTSALAQTVYKWVDENGNVQFSDRPPLEAQAEELQLRHEAPPPATPAENGETQGESEALDFATVLPGRWKNVHPDQTIVMTLQSGGRSRWQVTFQGQNWSDLSGTWDSTDDRLTLTNQLGRTDYGLTVVSSDEIRLVNSDYGEPMVFTR